MEQEVAETSVLTATLYVVMPENQVLDLVEKTLPDCYTISRFNALSSLLEALNHDKPKMILCAQSLTEGNQKMVLSEILTLSSDTKVLMIGSSRPIETQIAALKNGARGYFDEALPLDKLHVALQSIMHGEVWVERHVIADLIDELTHQPALTDEQQQALDSLSPKELEVANLVSHGATNKMIAKAMDVSERLMSFPLCTVL